MTTATNFDHKKAATTFITSLGNGVKALETFDAIMQDVVVSRNTNAIANLIERTEKKGDNVASGMIRFAFGRIFQGAKLTTHKDTKKITVKIAGVVADKDAMGRLSGAAGNKISIRSKALRAALIGEVDPKVTPLDAGKRAASFAKTHSVTDIAAMIAALQTELKAKKAKKA